MAAKKYCDVASMKRDYETGKFTISDLAKRYGLCTGAAYYVLRDAGCVFIRTSRKPMSEETRKKLSELRKGKKLSEDLRRAISIRNSCNYDGMNGYGHTKKQNRGYILAYVPKHPHANKDGYVMLHTVLMEQKIGRYLTEDEEVHHINHSRTDNSISNLQLMTKHEHRAMHMKERHEKRRNALLTVYG